MARQKQATPLRRELSAAASSSSSSQIVNGDAAATRWANGSLDRKAVVRRGSSAAGAGAVAGEAAEKVFLAAGKSAGLAELVVCIAGIYASFLTWALLQERITTKEYGAPGASERWSFPIFLNTVQSLLAALTGYLYLVLSSPAAAATPRRTLPIFPSSRVFPPLILVAVTSSLASPFGYASLKHIDYITFILAKSCKLLPVMALHLTIFRKRYPLYKYAVVALVTAGVAVFTLHHPASSSSSKKKSGSGSGSNSSAWGLLLLSINLLFDGLTNSTQDYIFQTFRPYSGPQMMCAQNILNTALTGAWMLLAPSLRQTGLGDWLGMDLAARGQGEFGDALAFIQRNPGVGRDVLGFAACGAVGQVFICKCARTWGGTVPMKMLIPRAPVYTLSHFSSLLLVTVTVTRKMLTMMLSVVWFGHRLSSMQWLGVGLVFGGVGAEAEFQRREKAARGAQAGKKKA
ncbi:MAG: UDP-galactose transporter [Trizodia sp. TS-e1964]|nr:MAG: UDP-galactose transporter [Trizodia sp. TS-e1964]